MHRSQPTSRCSTRREAEPGVHATNLLRSVQLLLCSFALAALAAACTDPEPALVRGDRFWADSNYADALAEYRLALRQQPTRHTRARVAHAYIETGQFERAREIYDQLIAEEAEYTDQAIFDYVRVARRAAARSDRYSMASAVDAATRLRPGLPLDDLAQPLARYYASTGDPPRALDFYERALSVAPPDSVPDLLFEIAQMHESQGNCAEATGFFRTFLSRARRHPRAGEAQWHIGNCAWTLGRRAQQAGNAARALDYLDTVIALGVPENLVDDAWFERGEIMIELGRRDDAMTAFQRVLELNRTGNNQLVDRARRRIDQLRFGRGVLF